MSGEETNAESVRAGEGREPDTHSHEYTQMVIHRLSRAIGHLESVKKMVEEGRGCTEVLIQLSAVRGAVSSISRTILKDHMEQCLMDAVQNGSHDALDELNRAIDQIMR